MMILASVWISGSFYGGMNFEPLEGTMRPAFQRETCSNCSSPLSSVLGSPCSTCGYMKKDAGATGATITVPLGNVEGYMPTWSNDSKSIAFAVKEPKPSSLKLNQDYVLSLYSFNLGNSAPTLQTDPMSQWYVIGPKWALGRDEIAYRVLKTENGKEVGEIEMISLSTKRVSKLRLGREASSLGFDWSAKGKFIVFSSGKGDQCNIYLSFLDTNTAVALTKNMGECLNPNVSLDASRILFNSNSNGNIDIYSITSDGTDIKRLTTHSGFDQFGSWSPDGTQIVFESNRTGTSKLFTMNADGSNQVQLTFGSDHDSNASWSPDGSKIAYQSKVNNQIVIKILTMKR